MRNATQYEYQKCTCGAITVYVDDVGYSCSMKNRERFFPGMDLRKLRRLPETCCCNWCVNHWGLDLCACGSGLPYEECDELPVCGTPMQVLGGRTHVRADDAIGA